MNYNKIQKREYKIRNNVFKVLNTSKLFIDILYEGDYEEGVPYRTRLRDYNGLFFFYNNEKKIFFCDEDRGLILNNDGDPVCSNCKNSVGQSEERAGVVNKIGEAFCYTCYENIFLK